VSVVDGPVEAYPHHVELLPHLKPAFVMDEGFVDEERGRAFQHHGAPWSTHAHGTVMTICIFATTADVDEP
jgi:hypothetical protein